MTTLYIARHGNTFDKGDRVRRVGRRTDLPLSASGETQAKRLGDYFQKARLRFDKVFAAPLQRTMQTAHLICMQTQEEHSVVAYDGLTEIDYGVDENQPEETVLERIGETAMRRWNEEAIPPEGWQVDPDALRRDWRRFFEELSHLADNACVLAVTSNGVARFALDAADISPKNAPRKLRTGAYGIVAIKQSASGLSAEITEWDSRP